MFSPDRAFGNAMETDCCMIGASGTVPALRIPVTGCAELSGKMTDSVGSVVASFVEIMIRMTSTITSRSRSKAKDGGGEGFARMLHLQGATFALRAPATCVASAQG